MAFSKNILHWLALLLGFFGLLACLLVLASVWYGTSRLNSKVEVVFGKTDDSLIVLRERVLRARDRVEEAKITTEGVKKVLQDWTKRETRDRLRLELGIEQKVDRLAAGLEKADQWLEFSQSSVELVQRALELGNSMGIPIETVHADKLLAELGELRSQLTEAGEKVGRIRESVADASADRSVRERIDQAVQLVIRVTATFGSLDSRLGDLDGRILEAQGKADRLETKMIGWIRIAALGISVLILWMAAGQLTLCLHGWRGLQHAAHDDVPSS